MRQYPVDSPLAAARIVALTSVADAGWPRGHVDVMRGLRLVEQLGLDGPSWHEVLAGVCQDLMFSAQPTVAPAGTPSAPGGSFRLDGHELEHLLAEVRDPQLQHKVLELCLALVEDRSPINDTESQMLATAVDQWGLTDEILAHGRS